MLYQVLLLLNVSFVFRIVTVYDVAVTVAVADAAAVVVQLLLLVLLLLLFLLNVVGAILLPLATVSSIR